MRALPATWGTLHHGNSTPIFLIRVIPSDTDTWQPLRFATSSVYVEEEDGNSYLYEDKLLFLGDIEQSFDPREPGGLAHVGNFTFSFANFGTWDNRNLYNRKVELFLTFKELEPISLDDDCLLLFRGLIRRTKVNKKEVRLTCYDQDYNKLKRKLTETITKENYPESTAIGKEMGVPFGEKVLIEAYPISNSDEYIKLKTGVVGWKYLGIRKIITSLFDGCSISSVFANNTAGLWVEIPNQDIGAIAKIIPVIPIPTENTTNITDATAAINNDDINTYMLMESSFGEIAAREFQIHIDDIPNAELSSRVYFLIKACSNAQDTEHELWIKWRRSSDTAWIEEKFVTDFRTGPSPECINTWEWTSDLYSGGIYSLQEIADSFLRLEWRSGNSPERFCRVFAIAIGIDYLYPNPPNRFWALMDGAVWDESWGRDSGLMTHPSRIIEAILRYVGIEDIDISSFDEIAMDNYWQTRGVAEGTVEQVLDEILKEFSSLLISTPYKIKWMDYYTPPVRTLYRADLTKDEVIEYFPPQYTKIILKYNFDPLRECYRNIKEYGFSNQYNVDNVYTWESKWIYTQITAADCVLNKAYMLCKPYRTSTFTTTLKHIDLEVGDVIETPTFTGIIYSLRISPSQASIEIKIREIAGAQSQ